MDMAVLRGNTNNACSQNRMTKVEIMVGGGASDVQEGNYYGIRSKSRRIYGSVHRLAASLLTTLQLLRHTQLIGAVSVVICLQKLPLL